MKFESKYKTFHSWKCTWKCNLRNGGHFVQGEMSWLSRISCTSVRINRGGVINSLWPSDTIWRHWSESTLAHEMACCLTAPNHYLNQCWLIISKAQRHSSEGNFTINTSVINHWNELENSLYKISFKSPSGQWVNSLAPGMYDSDFKNIIFKLIFAWTFAVGLPSGQCHRISLIRSQHWLR